MIEEQIGLDCTLFHRTTSWHTVFFHDPVHWIKDYTCLFVIGEALVYNLFCDWCVLWKKQHRHTCQCCQ